MGQASPASGSADAALGGSENGQHELSQMYTGVKQNGRQHPSAAAVIVRADCTWPVLFRGRGQCVTVGMGGTETKMAFVAPLAAIGLDLEQPAKNELKETLCPGAGNLRATAVRASGIRGA